MSVDFIIGERVKVFVCELYFLHGRIVDVLCGLYSVKLENSDILCFVPPEKLKKIPPEDSSFDFIKPGDEAEFFHKGEWKDCVILRTHNPESSPWVEFRLPGRPEIWIRSPKELRLKRRAT